MRRKRSLEAIQRDLLDVVFGIDVSHWQGELDWLQDMARRHSASAA